MSHLIIMSDTSGTIIKKYKGPWKHTFKESAKSLDLECDVISRYLP
jgi:predicted transcriptional regulator